MPTPLPYDAKGPRLFVIHLRRAVHAQIQSGFLVEHLISHLRRFSSKIPNPNNSKRNDDVGRMIGPSPTPSVLEEDGEIIVGPPPGGGVEDEDGVSVIGPPRPPSGRGINEEDNDELVIGAPRPPPGGDVKDEGLIIGQPRPPPGEVETDSEGDTDEEDEDPGY